MKGLSKSYEAELERAYGPAVPKPVNAPKAAPAASGDEYSPLLFLAACKLHGLPEPLPEYRFSERRWRFDWAWEMHKVALEIEGGVWTKGRHTRGKGFLKDIEKYNAAALAGWKLLRCIPADVKDGSVFALLKRALARPQ